MEFFFKRCLFSCALFFCLAAFSHASSTTTITAQIKQLLSQQQYEAAYNLGLNHQFELEGEPEFDLYWGLSAIQAGKFETALFNFERLISSYPQVHRYRLELARCYFYLGNLERAEAEFKRVQAEQPPAAVLKNIELFLDQIAQQKRSFKSQWYGRLTLASGYDTNINSATNAENFILPLANFNFIVPISDKEREQASSFGQAQAFLGYQRPLSRLSSWGALLMASHKANFETSDYNLSQAFVQADYRRLWKRLQLRSSASFNQYWLASESFQQNSSVNTEAYWLSHNRWQPFARLTFTHIDNKVNQDLDRLQFQQEIGIGSHWGRLNSQLSAQSSQDNARNKNKAYMRDSFGFDWSGQYRYLNHELYSQVKWQKDHYQEDFVAFNKTRQDTLVQALVGYRYQFNKQVSAYLQSSWLDNDSNLTIYQYQRVLSEAGLSLGF